MNEDNAYLVYETAMARLERANKRMFIMLMVVVFALFGSNLAWVYYESQFEDKVITAEQDGNGINIVGGGDIDYGAESND